MWYRIRRIVQYAGLITVSAFLCNGITYNPFAAADKIEIETSAPFSYQSPLDVEESDAPIRAAASESYGKLPLSFEANNGQVDEAVKFLSRGNGYTLYLTANEAVLSLKRGSVTKDEQQALRKNFQTNESETVESAVIRLKNIGANANPKITGLEELPGKSNYFIGNDPAKWHTNVPNYTKIAIEDIYPGIDLVYYGNQRQLEFDWIVAPCVDPNAIRIAVESKADLTIDSQGNLLLDEKGDLRLNKPVIYQEQGGDRVEIAGQYVILDSYEVSIQVGRYNSSLPLVIDPILAYASYLGGDGADGGRSIAVDVSGNVYVSGYTNSTDLATTNSVQTGFAGGGQDAFVAKLNATGDSLIYCTYLGGENDDSGRGIAADSSGNAYVTGSTGSAGFPVANPLQVSIAGGRDAFIAKLNASGDRLVYSTYLGGSSSEIAGGVAVDASGNTYVIGTTYSADFPTANAFQASFGGHYDVFVTKLNASGNLLVYSTYLGGDYQDMGEAIAVDSSGNAYMAGTTGSIDFPTANPFQTGIAGGHDAFVAKLNGNALIYSTYLGGSRSEVGSGIAVDSSGNAYVAGYTSSTDFPTANPFQANYAGQMDAFVTKLNAPGNALVYSTYLGGSSDERDTGIAVDTLGNAHLTGGTESTDFPTANAFQATSGGSKDIFAAMLNATGDSLVYGTYIGGGSYDVGTGIAVDSSGNAYVTGAAGRVGLTALNAFQADFGGGGYDAFVIKIAAVNEFFFSEIAVGAGWSTTFELFNTGNISTSGYLYLYDQQGNDLYVNSSDLGANSWFPISILPGGSMFLTATPYNPTGPALHGWAGAEFWGGDLSGVATYQFESEGIVTALAGVLPSQSMQFATTPVDDNINEARTTAYAIANPTDQYLSVRLCLVDTDGNVVDDTVILQLSPGQQIARYFFQDFGFSEFQGTVVLRAQGNGAFVAVGLIQNQDLFTVTPVEAGKAPNIPD